MKKYPTNVGVHKNVMRVQKDFAVPKKEILKSVLNAVNCLRRSARTTFAVQGLVKIHGRNAISKKNAEYPAKNAEKIESLKSVKIA